MRSCIEPLKTFARRLKPHLPGILAHCRWAPRDDPDRIDTALIDPGKPWQNDTDESFNGKFRDECLSLEWFRSRREAATSESWRKHCNAVRPHQSLAYLVPLEFKQHHSLPPHPQLRATFQE